jgi:hypothetical protein
MSCRWLLVRIEALSHDQAHWGVEEGPVCDFDMETYSTHLWPKDQTPHNFPPDVHNMDSYLFMIHIELHISIQCAINEVAV